MCFCCGQIYSTINVQQYSLEIVKNKFPVYGRSIIFFREKALKLIISMYQLYFNSSSNLPTAPRTPAPPPPLLTSASTSRDPSTEPQTAADRTGSTTSSSILLLSQRRTGQTSYPPSRTGGRGNIKFKKTFIYCITICEI